MNFEIGKFYRVPFIKAANGKYNHLFRTEWVPIMGPEHRDAEIVGFPHTHWHVDWRFVGERMFGRAKNWHSLNKEDGDVFNYVLQRYGVAGNEERESDPFVESGEVVIRRAKCRRPMPAYPLRRAVWLRKLQNACAGMAMTNMTCPHRGLPLEGCERDGDVVQCPGHGLRWNVKTGELVT